MTAGKRQVRIRIESSGGGQSSKLQAEGEWYETTTGSSYVRYPEPDPSLGKTTTMVKWNDKEVRVLRHGEIESDQTFVSGARMAGNYWLPASSDPAADKMSGSQTRGRMLLECVTRTIAHKSVERGHSVKWKYELYVDGQYTGVYKIRLDIEEKE